jgi:hypothetical protein
MDKSTWMLVMYLLMSNVLLQVGHPVICELLLISTKASGAVTTTGRAFGWYVPWKGLRAMTYGWRTAPTEPDAALRACPAEGPN